MTNQSTIHTISTEVAQAIIPLKTYFSTSSDFSIFMKQLGWNLNEVPIPIANLMPSIDSLLEKLNIVIEGDASAGVYLELANSISVLTQNIRDLQNGSFDPILTSENFAQIFPKQLLDYVLIIYLNNNQYALVGILEFLGIIENTQILSTTNRPTHILKEIRWERISNLFTQPQDFLQHVYGWGTPDFDFNTLTQSLLKVFGTLGMYPQLQLGDNNLIHQVVDSPDVLTNNNFILNFSLYSLINNNANLEGNFQLWYLPQTSSSLPGLGLMPNVKGGFHTNLEISRKLTLSLGANLDIGGDVVLVKRPQEPLKLLSGLGEGNLAPISGSFNVLLDDKSLHPTTVLKNEDKSGIVYDAFGIKLIFESNSQERNEIRFELKINGLKIIIDPSNGDNFVQKILPKDGITIESDLVLGYSNIRGFYFEGSGGLEYQLPIHKSIGPINIENSLLSFLYQNSLIISAGIDFSFDIGSIATSVKGIGLKGEISIGNGGNLLGIDFQLGFKPPTGAGISINAPPVTGGGFLNYDQATSTYTGGLELNFSKISFSAIGIISTKLPGGEDGYSLLIIISAEFTPIQLGMGFTLSGIGGILGLNRTMNPDVLRAGIKDHTLDHILFPVDIVANANSIISSMDQAFPIKKDQFLIGPMAKIGWGTPTLLTIELGIIIELPEPVRLAILGVLRAILPDENKRVLQLQVNFLGIIDFTNKYLSFDASIYDSKILTFSLFGDMALRLYWGDKPNFLLSVGGFHPKFNPPPLNLPELKRLSIILVNHSKLKIGVEAYFAVTSNSVQFGAKVAAMAKVWKIEAIGALWFDILFQFRPFYFVADMGVMFAIKMGSKTLLSLFINLTLEGPNPWRAQGKGSFKVLFVRVKVSFDKTFGTARVEAIEAVEIDHLFQEALGNPDNWEVQLPERNHQLIAWKELPEENLSDLIIDPAGRLQFNQKLLPLDIELSKFGNAPLSDFKRYRLSGASAGNPSQAIPLSSIRDYFAANEFFYLTEDEKLSKDAYEQFNSGALIGTDDFSSEYAVHREIGYDHIIIDSGYMDPRVRYILTEELFSIHSFGNYISDSPLSRFKKITTSAGPAKVAVSLEEDEFVLINRNNMSQVVAESFANSEEAQMVLQDYRENNPAAAEDWIIANKFELYI